MSVRILVVEDDLIQQQVLACLLEARGYLVETARTGLEAIRKVRARLFDVVLMDYLMPDVDGLAAARLIASDAKPHHRLRLIAVSASLDQVFDLETGTTSVFDFVVRKPWEADSLLATIERCQDPALGDDPVPPARTIVGASNSGPSAGAISTQMELELFRRRADPIKKHALLVDADDSLLTTLRCSLEEIGYMVDTAVDRPDALRKMGEHDYDVVLADYMTSARFCGSPAAFAAGVRGA